MTSQPTISARLDRIDIKLETLTDTMINLARVEEKQNALQTALVAAVADLSRQSERLNRLEAAGSVRSTSIAWLERAAWAAILGLVTFFYSEIRK